MVRVYLYPIGYTNRSILEAVADKTFLIVVVSLISGHLFIALFKQTRGKVSPPISFTHGFYHYSQDVMSFHMISHTR